MISIILTSISSTTLLHLVTLPYITKLSVILENDDDSLLRGTRLSMLGNDQIIEFSTKNIKRGADVIHPFASFEADGKWMYIHADSIQNNNIKKILS